MGCTDQLGHVLGSQVICLHGDQNIVRCGKGIDNQHTERRTAVQQHIIVILLHLIEILPQHRFSTHHIDQSNLDGGQAAVGRDKIKALRMMQDFRVPVCVDACYNVIHDIGKRQRHIMGLSLAQHFGQIALRVHVQQQNLFSVDGQSRTDTVDAGAFADAALLIGDGYDLCFRHLGLLLFIYSAAHIGERLCKGMKKPPTPK